MPKKVIKLEDWSVVYPNKNPYTPPESTRGSLHGIADNHPKLGRNAEVTTSSIVSSEGRFVKTYGGHTYALGEPDPDYLVWLKVNGIELNEDKPVNVKI